MWTSLSSCPRNPHVWSIRSPSAGASMCRPVLLSPWRPGTLLTISPNFPLPHASCSFPVAYSDASRCSSFPAWLATALSILPELVPLSSRDTQGLGCSPPPTCLQPTDSPPNTWQSHSRILLVVTHGLPVSIIQWPEDTRARHSHPPTHAPNENCQCLSQFLVDMLAMLGWISISGQEIIILFSKNILFQMEPKEPSVKQYYSSVELIKSSHATLSTSAHLTALWDGLERHLYPHLTDEETEAQTPQSFAHRHWLIKR